MTRRNSLLELESVIRLRHSSSSFVLRVAH